MAVTVMGPALAAFPRVVESPVVRVKRAWSDPWSVRPDLRVISASRAAAAQDLGACRLVRRYGNVKEPWESAFGARGPVDLVGYWVRVRFLGDQGAQTAWVGRISSESRTVHGSDAGVSGVQTWVAYEPMQGLLKTNVSESIWLVAGSERRVGWLPAFNGRDSRGMLVGNRSSVKSNGTYLFGDSPGSGSPWTRFDAAEYLIKRFADESASGGPVWTLGGQADLLKDVTDGVGFGDGSTVAEMLGALVSTEMGVDYDVVATDGGFEVSVYALSARDWSFGGKSLPRNPNTVRVVSNETADMLRVNLVHTADQRYHRVRVLGGRVVVCCSLSAETGSLVPKWDATLEGPYQLGSSGPNPTPEDNDRARGRDIYRNVYQLFGAPVGWDRKPLIKAGGVSVMANAAPLLDGAGVLQSDDQQADYQDQVRSTLGWLPLRENTDYTTDPATGHGPAGGHEADFLPPAVWLYDPAHDNYTPAERAGVGVSVSRTDLGVFLSASPNHLLAANHFSGADPSVTAPRYDHAKTAATVAFEADQRLVCVFEPPAGDEPAGASGVETVDVHVPDAQFWVLAAGTVVGVDDAGKLQTSGGKARVLRDDSPRLALVMAGAIARYSAQRGRAEVVIRGLRAWGGLVGQILTVVEEGGDTTGIQAPITGVRWDVSGDPTTTILTGFAL